MSCPNIEYPHRISEDFAIDATSLSKATQNLQTSLNNTRLISRANFNNLMKRLETIQFKLKDVIDDMEELQYDLDKEDIKERSDPQTEDRIRDFEKTYDTLTPILGLALMSYLYTE
jgi:hypothetical protein